MRTSERGNVFFYIFICIALLAALSYAVAQGGRDSIASLSEERQELLATDIIAYSDTVSKAVTMLRLRGTPETALSFANPFISSGAYGTYNNDPGNEIFNPAGGAVVYSDPPEQATTTGTEEYLFLSDNEIEGVGATCGGDSCSDLLMIIANMREEVCTRLNDMLGVTNPAGAPPTDADIDESAFFKPAASPFGAPTTVGDEDTALVSKHEGCFEETGDNEFIYYRVLLAR
ncbi:MAG: hypothetical protein H6867_02925 [Rhodospirillales bacterium]|nr:hypothetical protein [Rhodospirillales bacterium]MCB9996104.1 hypothetical protein [Rhodospirillales bacterium]